ncbi:patatin-like phospholipase family protein [Actinomyces bowdenii]|uniref:Patatin-like phospholipase family protein n=1 Tax=Actinomyces bowdenii TaxID=131109 RepID=A0A853EMA6_9ACTO|nr:patatin family protein [Actinomyces bowdenii]MBF0698275.1 patatin-like phospholipase family protein [Actinomyces bowdenii]NYS70447.1 patatin-like phospholipase family protein [Actinomyces bowdenii]
MPSPTSPTDSPSPLPTPGTGPAGPRAGAPGAPDTPGAPAAAHPQRSRPAPPGPRVPFGHPDHRPAPITHGPRDVALIFEGGGMRGAYTAALVRVMLEAGLSFPWVGGISAGCTHTCNFVSRDTWRAREAFVSLAADPRIGGWGSFLRGRGYFNSEYIYEHTSEPQEALPFDWPTFSASASTVRIGALRCDTGRSVYWGLEDMPTMAHLLPRARASSSMPVLMPMVRIDGVPYMDGALGPTGGFALDAARADGYERFLVVMTRPRGYVKPPVGRPGAYRGLFARYPALARGIIERPANYNRTVAELEELQRRGRAYLFRPERMPVANGELRYDRIVSAFEAGLAQAYRELPALEDFLAG